MGGKAQVCSATRYQKKLTHCRRTTTEGVGQTCLSSAPGTNGEVSDAIARLESSMSNSDRRGKAGAESKRRFEVELVVIIIDRAEKCSPSPRWTDNGKISGAVVIASATPASGMPATRDGCRRSAYLFSIQCGCTVVQSIPLLK